MGDGEQKQWDRGEMDPLVVELVTDELTYEQNGQRHYVLDRQIEQMLEVGVVCLGLGTKDVTASAPLPVPSYAVPTCVVPS